MRAKTKIRITRKTGEGRGGDGGKKYMLKQRHDEEMYINVLVCW